jgi:lipoyl(octanoyl) transferase
LVPYEEAWRLQMELLEARHEGRIPDTLLFLEHPAVITLGRKTPGVREGKEFPAEIGGVPVRVIERGGEATYHGPGQLVVYPIVRLNIRFGPKAFLRLLEESMISALASLGLNARWQEGKTGVWLLDSQNRERKIASLGIAVRRGVSYHGLALNVRNDLRPFSLIQPCGLEGATMTSATELLGRPVPVDELAAPLEAALRERLPIFLGAAESAV